MAREFGDRATARRLGRKLAKQDIGRFFDGGGTDRDEYCQFFRYGEEWPRGQESALGILRDLFDGEGEWGRAFEPDTEKLAAPSVTDVAYPKVG